MRVSDTFDSGRIAFRPGGHKRGQEPFGGLPRLRVVLSSANCRTASDTHCCEPYGRRPRLPSRKKAPDPFSFPAAIRAQVANLDGNQPLHDPMALEDLRAKSLTARRVDMLLLGTFAALGLLLASVGIYGVVSYSVSHRTHEIGVRMALGARQGEILKLVIAQGLFLALIGTGIGLIASLALTPLLRTMLFGIEPTDPATFLAVGVLLSGVALAACYVPAHRATKVDPMVALRYE